MVKEHIQMKAYNDVSNNQKLRIILEIDMYLPCSPGPAPSSRTANTFPLYTSSEEAPNDNPLSTYIINGWFVTAGRMFQRAQKKAVRCCCLINAVGRGKERVPAVSLSLWPCPFHPLPQHTTAPTLKLATSNRKVQVLPSMHFRRGIERQPVIHENGCGL